MFRVRRRHVLRLYEQPLWRVPRPRVVRDRARWDMVEVENGLDTLAHVQPPSFDDWLAINSHRVAPYTVGWSCCGRAGGTHLCPATHPPSGMRPEASDARSASSAGAKKPAR